MRKIFLSVGALMCLTNCGYGPDQASTLNENEMSKAIPISGYAVLSDEIQVTSYESCSQVSLIDLSPGKSEEGENMSKMSLQGQNCLKTDTLSTYIFQMSEREKKYGVALVNPVL